MIKVMAGFIAGFLLIFKGFAMQNNIVYEVQQVRVSNKETNIDISEIVKKYILVGTHKMDVENYLKAQMFSLNDQPILPNKTQTLVAVYVEKKFLANFGFNDEVRVIVVFENGVVKSAGGKLIYRSL